MAIANFKAGDLVKELTLQVNLTGTKVFVLRLFIGRQFLKLAAWVMGCGIEINGGSN